MDTINGFIQHLQAQGIKNESTIYEYVYTAKELLEYLSKKGKTTANLTQKDVDDFVNNLGYIGKKDGQWHKYSNNSMINKSASLRHFIRYLGYEVKDKHGKGISIRIPSAQDTRTTPEFVLTYKEIQEMFNASKHDPLANAVLKTLYYSGLRRTELVNLDVSDVDFNQKILIVRNGKGMNNQPEIVSLDDIALEAIQAYLQVRSQPKQGHENALFITSTKQRMSRTKLARIIKEVQSRTTITKRVFPHMFRASIITDMHVNGAGDLHIMELSRHHSITALKKYTRTSISQKKEICNKFMTKITESEIKPTEKKPTPPKQPEQMYAKPLEPTTAPPQQVTATVQQTPDMMSYLLKRIEELESKLKSKENNTMFQ